MCYRTEFFSSMVKSSIDTTQKNPETPLPGGQGGMLAPAGFPGTRTPSSSGQSSRPMLKRTQLSIFPGASIIFL